jgi:phosphatidylinositol dimannoside acyltransferase
MTGEPGHGRGAGTTVGTRRLDLTWPALRRQFGECVILPVLTMSLPWPLAWRALRALARRRRFFGAETLRACAVANAEGYVHDAPAWSEWHRLTRIVDHVDPALSFARSDRWMRRHLVVDGDTVPVGPCMFVGFHYGAGFWSLRHLRRLGHRISFLAAPVTERHYPGQPLRLAFMRWRKVCVERAARAPVILVGGSRERIRAALSAGISVLGLVDVPEATTTPVSVAFLGRDGSFPDGLLRLAASEKVPLFAYVASLDPVTGARHLRFSRLSDDPRQALRALVAMLETAIRSDPPAWHLWAQWPRLVRRQAAASADEGSAATRVR